MNELIEKAKDGDLVFIIGPEAEVALKGVLIGGGYNFIEGTVRKYMFLITESNRKEIGKK